MDKINAEALMNSAKTNSIGNTKKEKLIIKTKKVSKIAFTLLLILCLAVSTCACNNYNKENVEYVDYGYVEMYTFEQTTMLKKYFRENGLEFQYANNTVEEYLDIVQYLNEDNMFIYYNNFGVAETDKICVALGYVDLNDFLKTKGYVDENGEPSISALKQASEVYMTQIVGEKMEKSK